MRILCLLGLHRWVPMIETGRYYVLCGEVATECVMPHCAHCGKVRR